MRKTLVIISGLLLGPIFFTLAAYTRTYSSIELIHISHFFLFFILGIITNYFQNKGFTFSRYLFPISFSLLYITIPFTGIEDTWTWVMFILDGSLMYLGFVMGYTIRNKVALFLTPSVITLLLLFVVKPIYVKSLYTYYYTTNKGIEKRLNEVLTVDGARIENTDGEAVDIKTYLRNDKNIIVFTFVGCKPCREKLAAIEKNIDLITQKKSVIVIHDGDLDPFPSYKKEALHHKKLNTFYDSGGILSESIKSYSQKVYPIEFTVDKDLTVLDYVKGYDSNIENLYIEKLLQ